MVQLLWKIVWRSLKQFTESQNNPAIPIVRIHPRERKTDVYTRPYRQMLMAALFKISRRWNLFNSHQLIKNQKVVQPCKEIIMIPSRGTGARVVPPYPRFHVPAIRNQMVLPLTYTQKVHRLVSQCLRHLPHFIPSRRYFIISHHHNEKDEYSRMIRVHEDILRDRPHHMLHYIIYYLPLYYST